MTGISFCLVLLICETLFRCSAGFLPLMNFEYFDDMAVFESSHFDSIRSTNTHKAIPSLITNRLVRAQYKRDRSLYHHHCGAQNLVSVDHLQPIPTIISNRCEQLTTKSEIKPRYLRPLKKVNLRSDYVAPEISLLPSVYYHNMRSLTSEKFEELKLVADSYDIIMLTETWLNKSKSKLYELDNFTMHASHRATSRTGGGVAVYTRNHLPVTKLDQYSTPHTSAYWFVLQQQNQLPVIYGNIYHPPGLPKKQHEETINHIVSTLSKSLRKHRSAKLVLCGDFNDLDTTPITAMFPVYQIVDFNTRENSRLDLVFTDIAELINHGCKRGPPIQTNDHCSISLPAINASQRPKYQTVQKRLITPSTKIALSQDLASMTWDAIFQEDDVEKQVEMFHSTITKVFDKHCPVQTARVPVGKPCITSPLIRKLSRAKQRAHNRNNPAWKFLAKLLSSQQKSALHTQTNNNINNTIKGSKTWWQNIKKLTGEINKTSQSPVIYIEDSWHSIGEFTSKLNRYYLQDHIEVEFPEIPTAGNSITVNELEIYHLLNDINTHKANHSADFPSWISKNNSHLLASPVTYIVNNILSSGHYPSRWKTAEIKPLNKIPNPVKYKDMRPISLLYHLGKVVEKVISRHLKAELPTLSHQYAYTRALSTTDALVKFVSDTVTALDDKTVVANQALMLDFSKAFDRMCPKLAIQKMLAMNVNTRIIQLVRSFLSGRSQCVRYGGVHSDYKSCFIGVPQGTILGPVLWNIFIDDLAPAVNFVKYADDTTLYHSLRTNEVSISDSTASRCTISLTHNPLQDAANYTSNWCRENKMLLNTTKSNQITFSLKKEITSSPITIDATDIAEVESTKLLGVVFDKHLRFSDHVTTIIDKCRPAFHAISKLRKAGVDDSSLALFYKSRITPLLSYAAPAWYPMISKQDRERLEKYQRLCLRVILPNVTHTDERQQITGIDDINVQLDISCLRYVDKVRSNADHPLHNLTNLHSKSSRSGRRLSTKSRTALQSKSLFYRFV